MKYGVTPNNGTKTHPMSPQALRAQAALKDGPAPKATLNPGIVDRLIREGTAELVWLPSPYKTHKGRSIMHIRLITTKGVP